MNPTTKKTNAILLDASILALFLLIYIVPWYLLLPDKIDLSAISANLANNSGFSTLFPLGRDFLGRNLLTRLQLAAWTTVLPLWISIILSFASGIMLAWLALSLPKSRLLAAIGFAAATLLSSIPISIVILFISVLNDYISLSTVIIGLCLFVQAHSYISIQNLYLRSYQVAYWQAHVALGGSFNQRFLRYGILGDWKQPLMQLLSFYLAISVTVEASISYLGFGVQEPGASFGNIFSAHLSQSMMGHFSVTLFTTLALAVMLMSPISLLHFWSRHRTA